MHEMRANPQDPERSTFLPILLEDNLAVDAANSAPTISKIPFVREQFTARMNQCQLTLSYRLLPLNSRNAAQNGPPESRLIRMRPN